ncbi:hypothetical protein [Plantactinospora soyae]|uniref:Uncharacterized protein n=1 Tax=Plantactinospora soyae TaxID=1544732 RepID=A0A927QVJ3_9ACTN|nr:hypothetical protein [Plantactinospora soyae]MBE1484442.1 hypothetical protein [Plantactinospora soyae]
MREEPRYDFVGGLVVALIGAAAGGLIGLLGGNLLAVLLLASYGAIPGVFWAFAPPEERGRPARPRVLSPRQQKARERQLRRHERRLARRERRRQRRQKTADTTARLLTSAWFGGATGWFASVPLLLVAAACGLAPGISPPLAMLPLPLLTAAVAGVVQGFAGRTGGWWNTAWDLVRRSLPAALLVLSVPGLALGWTLAMPLAGAAVWLGLARTTAWIWVVLPVTLLGYFAATVVWRRVLLRTDRRPGSGGGGRPRSIGGGSWDDVDGSTWEG